MKKVVAFGTFDGLHEGHLAFLKQARRCGDHLTVVVARDHIVNRLKSRAPKLEFSRRCELLSREAVVDEVVHGDPQIGSWHVLEKVGPDIIAIGHDQTLLRKSLESFLQPLGGKPEIRVMGFHDPKNAAL